MTTLPAAETLAANRPAPPGQTLNPDSPLGPGETGSAVEAALLAGLGPRDEAERFMIVQMAVVHEAVLDCAEEARRCRAGSGARSGRKTRRRGGPAAGLAARQAALHLAARLMTLYARQMATLDQHRALGAALERARTAAESQRAERAEAARVRARFDAEAAKTKALQAQWLEGLAVIENQLAAGGPDRPRQRGGAGDRLPLPRPEFPPELPPETVAHAEFDPIDPEELEGIEDPADLAALLERAAAGAADPATMDRLLEMAGEWVEGDAADGQV